MFAKYWEMYWESMYPFEINNWHVLSETDVTYNTTEKFIFRIIYPQNKEGKPMINPCGKYVVKLRINGVARKVCNEAF